MNRLIRKTAMIASLVTLLGAPMLATPALAGGSIAFLLAPRTAQQAQAMDFSLRAYALYNGLKSGARIRQIGQDNIAGVAQNGADNVGIVRQQGDGHSATLQQQGNGNSYGLFQFGRNTRTDVVQAGDGQTGAAVTFGW